MFSMIKKHSMAKSANFNSNIKAICAAPVCSSEDSAVFNHEDTRVREADIS